MDTLLFIGGGIALVFMLGWIIRESVEAGVKNAIGSKLERIIELLEKATGEDIDNYEPEP